MNKIRTTAAAVLLIFGTVASGQMFHMGVNIDAASDLTMVAAAAYIHEPQTSSAASRDIPYYTAAPVETTATVSVQTTSSSVTAAATTTRKDLSTEKGTASAAKKSVSEEEEKLPEEAEEPAGTVTGEDVPEAPAEETTESSAETEAVTEAPATTTTPPPTTTTPSATTTIVTEMQELSREIINYRTQKAMWLSMMDISPMILNKTEYQFRSSFETVCSNCKDLGVNTLYFHVRPFGDSYYSSTVFPWSRYASGAVGRSPGYDPLAAAIEIAHKHGLSLHAWINPYRVGNGEDILAAPDSFAVKKWLKDPRSYPDFVNYVEDTGRYWMDPGRPEVRSLITAGVREIVENYEVDGIHIDDYFYPTTESWFDDSSYARYGAGRSLKEFRLANCTATVKAMYDTVKDVDEDLLFGIAPQGNYENNYVYMYADVAKWLSTPGYCDYLAPQIYFGYLHKYKPFLPVLSQWASLKRDSSVSLVIGIAAANMELVDEFNDSKGIISLQIKDSLKVGAGIALYRYDSFFNPAKGYEQRAASEVVYVRNALKNK